MFCARNIASREPAYIRADLSGLIDGDELIFKTGRRTYTLRKGDTIDDERWFNEPPYSLDWKSITYRPVSPWKICFIYDMSLIEEACESDDTNDQLVYFAEPSKVPAHTARCCSKGSPPNPPGISVQTTRSSETNETVQLIQNEQAGCMHLADAFTMGAEITYIQPSTNYKYMIIFGGSSKGNRIGSVRRVGDSLGRRLKAGRYRKISAESQELVLGQGASTGARALAGATCGGDAGGAPCDFPFFYNLVMYSECTDVDSADGKPWCYTTNPGKWGTCDCTPAPEIPTPSGDSRLAAYWDYGVCGPRGDDYNWEWCNERSFECQAEVKTELCQSGSAKLINLYGTGESDPWNINIDGCDYAYYAQYECSEASDDLGQWYYTDTVVQYFKDGQDCNGGQMESVVAFVCGDETKVESVEVKSDCLHRFVVQVAGLCCGCHVSPATISHRFTGSGMDGQLSGTLSPSLGFDWSIFEVTTFGTGSSTSVQLVFDVVETKAYLDANPKALRTEVFSESSIQGGSCVASDGTTVLYKAHVTYQCGTTTSLLWKKGQDPCVQTFTATYRNYCCPGTAQVEPYARQACPILTSSLNFFAGRGR
jgi:hypothetical protein